MIKRVDKNQKAGSYEKKAHPRSGELRRWILHHARVRLLLAGFHDDSAGSARARHHMESRLEAPTQPGFEAEP